MQKRLLPRAKRQPSRSPNRGLMLQFHPFKSRPTTARKPLKPISLSATRLLVQRIAEQELALALATP
ncbi:MAG: hypothetical protein EOS03_12480 [Mesorhizobium sp.]|uniref:hypothetical protein n=1 Tax=Mesorhizobium sp. TaxID=1871066 RepID=UPI000FE9E8B5|nr:hypothetical protein [Mesorhizobium sp.]RWN47167.1 MAG: hypothetical protein EOS03_12480 [Mesorhizobium sp.]